MDHPEVSVVMSVYNGASWLGETIESILAQDGLSFEFIIVNDGSTDDSCQIIYDYEKIDQRIRVIHKMNEGLTKALIDGCTAARGEFIARQDVGDISLPERLRKQLELLKSDRDIAFVSTWGQQFGPEQEFLNIIKRPGDSIEATKQLLHERQGPPHHGSVMFRKDDYGKVGGYRQEFYFGQDADLWLRMAAIGRIAYVSEVLYSFSFEPAGISALHRDIQKRFGVLGQFCHRARVAGESEAPYLAEAQALREQILRGKDKNFLQKRFANARTNYFIGSSLERQRDRRAQSYFLQAIKNNPFHAKAWARLMRGNFQ